MIGSSGSRTGSFSCFASPHRPGCCFDQTGQLEWIAPWGGSYFVDIARIPGSVMAIVSLLTSAAKLSLVTVECRPH